MFLPFVQFDFTHGLGPRRGRYVVAARDLLVRDTRRTDPVTGVTRHASEGDVLVIGTVEAPVALALPRRARARPVDGDGVSAPRPVALQRVALVGAGRPVGDAEGAAWLDRCGSDSGRAEADAWVDAGLDVLGLAIGAHRLAAGDPYATDVTRDDARSIRLGLATAEQAAVGRWSRALELPATRRGRDVAADEDLTLGCAVADALGGRSAFDEAHELALRVLLDLRHRRARAAAVGLRAAVDLALADGGDVPDEITAATTAIAERARRGPLDDGDVGALRSSAETLVLVLREGERTVPPGTRQPRGRSATSGKTSAPSPGNSV